MSLRETFVICSLVVPTKIQSGPVLVVCSPATEKLARRPLGNEPFGESWLSLLKVEQKLLGWMARRRACVGRKEGVMSAAVTGIFGNRLGALSPGT